MVRLFLLVPTLMVVAAACSSQTPTTSTTEAIADPTPSTVVAPGTGATDTTTTAESPPAEVEIEVPASLGDFAVATVWLDDIEIRVALADTSELRRRGLMQVDDLLDLEGMVFVFEQDSSSGFWLKDTLISLDIAFFDVAGRFVDGFTMEPCTTTDCPTYRPSGSYRFALEMAAGTMPAGVTELRFDQ